MLVCIEEPEAHLHPKAIREFASFLSKIVSMGRYISVAITTHSDYLLYAINNHILLSSSVEHKRVMEDTSNRTSLHYELVNAYILHPVCENGKCYTKVEKLKVDEKGIDESEFIKIAEELADERYRFGL